MSMYIPHARPHTAEMGATQGNLEIQISATFLGGK